MSLYSNVGFGSKDSEDVATKMTKNCTFGDSLLFEAPCYEITANIRINLIPPESRVPWAISLPLIVIFSQISVVSEERIHSKVRNASSSSSKVDNFCVNWQGLCMQPFSDQQYQWPYLSSFLRYGDVLVKNVNILYHTSVLLRIWECFAWWLMLCQKRAEILG